MALQHLRSGTANKRPIPTAMSDGQLAVNTNLASPGLFFKDSNGDLVKAGPVHVGTTAPNASPASTAATALVANIVYQILTVGTSDFTAVGASANTVGVVFTATGTTTGTGTVSGQQGNEKGEQWLDTTNSLYVMKVYDGTGWRVTDSISLANGSAAAPSLHFGSDTNTGLFRSAADQLAITTGGTQRVTVDSSGNVGVGNSSPSYKLSVLTAGTADTSLHLATTGGASANGDATNSVRFTGGTNTRWANAKYEAFTHIFNANGTEKMRIDSSGRLLVGTSTVQAHANMDDLQVGNGSGNRGITISSGASNFGTLAFGDSADNSGVDQYAGAIEYYHLNNSMSLLTSSVPRLTIDSSGNVHIGNSTNSAHTNRLLAVGKTDRAATYIEVRTSTSGDGGLLFSDGTGSGNEGFRGTVEYSHSSDYMHFKTAGTERLRIDSSGNVGIGTSSMAYNFEVKGSGDRYILVGSTNSAGASLILDGDANGDGMGSDYASIDHNSSGQLVLQNRSANSEIVFKNTSSSTERMRIDSSGRVGIGETSMDALLVIKGNSDANTTPSIRLKDGSDTREAWITNTAGDLILANGGNDNTPHCFLKMFDGNIMSFATANTERMRIDSSGNVLIGNPAGFNSGGIVNIQTDGNKTISFNASQGELGNVASICARNDSGSSLVPFGLRASDLRFATGSTERMRIDSSGNVFISGSTAASAKIAMYESGAMTIAGEIKIQGTSTPTGLSSRISKYGSLLIGTTSDAVGDAKCSIDSGTGKISSVNTASFGAGVNTGSTTAYGVKCEVATNAANVITQAIQTASGFTYMYRGYLGSSLTYYVTANGNAVFSGSVTASNVSDVRFKENITDAKPQLEDTVALGSQLKNFDWNDDAPLNEELRAKRFLGLVAQEAEKVCPGLTYTVPRTKQGKELTPAVLDEEGNETKAATYEELDDSYKAINHDILVMKLLGAVAELSAKVAALEAG